MKRIVTVEWREEGFRNGGIAVAPVFYWQHHSFFAILPFLLWDFSSRISSDISISIIFTHSFCIIVYSISILSRSISHIFHSFLFFLHLHHQSAQHFENENFECSAFQWFYSCSHSSSNILSCMWRIITYFIPFTAIFFTPNFSNSAEFIHIWMKFIRLFITLSDLQILYWFFTVSRIWPSQGTVVAPIDFSSDFVSEHETVFLNVYELHF